MCFGSRGRYKRGPPPRFNCYYYYYYDYDYNYDYDYDYDYYYYYYVRLRQRLVRLSRDDPGGT